MNKVPKILKRPIYFTIMIVSLLCLFALLSQSNIFSKLFSFGEYLETGYTKEVKSIELNSTGYDTSSPGAFNIIKSAEWTGKHEVTVKFDINTLEIPRNTNRHIILVMDTSESMDEHRMNSLNEAVTALTEDLFTNTNNKLALITFDTTSETKTGFTNNVTTIENIMTNLDAKGATNYYLGLKEVEQLLSTYSQPANTDTHLIFITDGYPTAGLGMYEMQYKQLLEKYPYLLTSAIQLEMGEHIVQPIEKISKYQYYAYQQDNDKKEDLSNVLLDVARAAEYYNSIELTDYVNSEYFTIDSSSINKTHGETNITTNNNEQKITWTIPEDKIKSGTIVDVELSFKIKLKDEYKNIEAYLPTNSSTTLNAKAEKISDITFTSTNTPVLQSWYEVIYNSNIPLGCSTNFELTEKHYPFDTVTINNEILSCPGSQFKGWEVADDSVTIISDESFIMPGHNTQVGAKWTELSINKSMIGTINSRTTLHTILANASTPDNEKSEYVTVYSSGINFWDVSSDTNGKGLYKSALEYSGQYPVYYFRGNVENNNVLFGNYCWKIIRTTTTGGIRMIYNGTPTNGQCTATGTNTTIGTTPINIINETSLYKYSLAYSGYMFGEEYETKSMNLGEDYWMQIVGLKETYMANSSTYLSENKYYSDSYRAYTATSGAYAGLETFQIGSSAVYTTADNAVGKYTLFGTTTTSYSTNGTIRYITRIDSTQNRVYTIAFDRNNYAEANGQDMYTYYYNKAHNTYWVYGNDVTYDSSTGLYTLKNTISLKPVEYGDNIDIVNGDTKYHYTCMSSSNTCSEVKYIFADTEQYMMISYITLTNGEKVEDAVNKMVAIPNQTKNTTLKNKIDSWYASNMINYTYMLEDSPYCNNLSINDDLNYGGWKNTGDSTTYMRFTEWDGNRSLECDTKYSYTVSTANGNGKLTYPVGLITTSEAIMAGTDYHTSISSHTNYYLYNGLTNWTMTTAYHNNLLAYFTTIDNLGRLYYARTEEESHYIRPVITLKPGVFASDGDGTSLNPYIIEME